MVLGPEPPLVRGVRLATFDAYQAAAKGGEGAQAVGGVMFDAATARIFENVLERARLTGQLEESS